MIIKLDKVANSGNDEFYTPEYAIDPILKYIKSGSTIWCPFDTQESLYIKKFKEHNCKVIATHINNGEDFFEIKPPKCDYIISNPPYSMKADVLERLFNLKIPFGMLLGVVGLFESQKRFELFRDNPFEIMYFNRRIAYFKDYSEQKPSLNPPFSSVYICQGILPRSIVFEVIEKK